ncbi:hypothetical protein J2S70_000995 [Trueperella bonasi]|uniref:Uncharacterized protein n=1 Tax=Trueperella bonasi TaxID=312286 RepID=A0ABT9NHD1_9ACTO|nr:hypothetical protein [Trueperella bonasi]MDP9806413.1 hypothetical protein [Trueperella bonasi]
MASHTDLVARIAESGAIPADRPIDHARRIITAITIGTFLGTFAGIFANFSEFTLGKMLVAFVPSLVMVILFLVVWQVVKTPRTGDPVPVIARTLATSESPFLRYVKNGSNKGLLVPVVVAPTDGSDAFRSVILLRETVPGVEVTEPEVGTLMALQQVEPGMGELANIAEVTPEQVELRDRLMRRPRILSNRAPALPMRRGVFERIPGWAAAQWWGGIVIAGLLVFAVISLLA